MKKLHLKKCDFTFNLDAKKRKAKNSKVKEFKKDVEIYSIDNNTIDVELMTANL